MLPALQRVNVRACTPVRVGGVCRSLLLRKSFTVYLPAAGKTLPGYVLQYQNLGVGLLRTPLGAK